jgi:DNA topoisomerase-6 subunit A
MDDIEALFSLEGVTREQLRFRPEEHGGSVAGELIVIDRDRETGRKSASTAPNGSGAYSIPASVEHLRFETKAKFILVIETGGMFARLNNTSSGAPRTASIGTAGVPTRATRRFVRKLADDKKIPVYAFNDCDPYGISNIYRTLKVGSGNAVHLNQFFCVPQARFLGVTPQDIIDFELRTRRTRSRTSTSSAPRTRSRTTRSSRPQGVAEGDRADAEDGRARRAAGARQVGPQLRDRRVPAGEAQGPEQVPAVTA